MQGDWFTWSPGGGLEVKARGEAYAVRAAGDVELGVGSQDSGTKGHGTARRLVWYQLLFTDFFFPPGGGWSASV